MTVLCCRWEMAVEDESDDDRRGKKQAAKRRSPSDSPGRSYSPPGTLRQHPAQFRAPDSHHTGSKGGHSIPAADVTGMLVPSLL
jgi:hypothetical protein